MPILYGCCCSFSHKKQFYHPFFNVSSYSHANECSGRFTVFESSVICCEFFFVESCLFSVELSCVCYQMLYNLQCRGRAVTNVVRTCSPTPLLYYKEQKNIFKLKQQHSKNNNNNFHGQHLWSFRDDQLPLPLFSWTGLDNLSTSCTYFRQ